MYRSTRTHGPVRQNGEVILRVDKRSVLEVGLHEARKAQVGLVKDAVREVAEHHLSISEFRSAERCELRESAVELRI